MKITTEMLENWKSCPEDMMDEIKKIILGGGHKCLSPERRFDAILFFSTDIFEVQK